MAGKDKLSAVGVKGAKGTTKPYKLSDGRGLFLLVNPNGSKYWRLAYRLGVKQKNLALGVFGDISLAEARIAAEEARRLIRQGIDPLAHRKEEKARKEKNSFKVLALEWHTKECGRWDEKHAKKIWHSLETDVFPSLGALPIENVTTTQCLAVIRAIESRGALDVASRVKQRMAAIFRYAICTSHRTDNPIDALKDVIQTRKVTHRQKLPTSELPAFLRDLENYQGQILTKLALKLLVITFVRPGELRKARWDEFDVERREWRIPAERMKMGEEHIVHLTDQALVILEEIRAVSGQYELLFIGAQNWQRPMSENTLTYAIRKRMGYNATAHGFRALASTTLNEAGFRSDVIERQLAHGERNKVKAAYNRALYISERREMMTWWADYIDSQRAGGAVVVPFKRGATG